MAKSSFPATSEARTRASLETEFTGALTTPGLSPLVGREWQALFPRYYAQLTRLPRRTRRALQRQWKRSLAALALLLALGQAPALAAILIDVDGTTCTLVNAITSANTDTANFGCPAGSGADTLRLVAGSTHTLTAVNNSTYEPTGLPVVSSVITIEGNGSTITRDSDAPEFRIFAVNDNGDLTLNETTVSGGVASNGYYGGGIANYGAVTLTNSTVSDNSAYRGGGVINFGAALTLTNSTVSGNNAVFGGGVFNDGALTLTNSTVSGNGGGHGGGVYNFFGGTVTLTNSTVSGNGGGYGGGVYNTGTVTLTDSTVSGNSADDRGGGVLNQSGGAILARSLVSGNAAPTGAEVYNDGNLAADNFNLFGHSGLSNAQAFSGFTPGASDITATSNGATPTPLVNILNSTLADHGGPTQTHHLAHGSPAIDAAGPGCPPPDNDQRGVFRPVGAACDIGSVELVLCGFLFSTIVGTPGDDMITGTSGNDRIHALSGSDVVDGLEGNDVVCGGSGSDILNGGSGADILTGQSGNDTVNGGSGADNLSGQGGNDTLNGGSGADNLSGQGGNDTLNGGQNADFLDGGGASTPVLVA